MMITEIGPIIAAVLVAGASTTSGWGLVQCNADELVARERAAQETRSARPGSADYVPKPFPRTVGEVVEDYEYDVLARAAVNESGKAFVSGLKGIADLPVAVLADVVNRVQEQSGLAPAPEI